MDKIKECLQKVHQRYEAGDTNYPQTSSEDFILRLAFANDGIGIWEKEVFEGVYWKELETEHSELANGTGSDDLPTDFLSFIRSHDKPAVISDGTQNNLWHEVRMNEGKRYEQEGATPNVFWVEAGKIRTLPAISGTIAFPYIKKLTRYAGTETTELEVDDEFLREYVLGRLYLGDQNFTLGELHLSNAKDILDKKKYDVIIKPSEESSFGIGM